MRLVRVFRLLLRRFKVHPRRWLAGFFWYPRYVGYIYPRLRVEEEAAFRAWRRVVSTYWWPRVLQRPVGKRLLVIAPHPDDESIGPGGLLWAHREMAQIHLILVCQGDKGGSIPLQTERPDSGAGSLAAVRRDELERVVQALGVKDVQMLGFPDGEVPLTQEAVLQLRNIVRSLRPDVVLLPWFLDNQTDHRSTNVLYAWACSDLEALVLAYEVWTPLEPNAVFDITNYLDGKRRLIQVYQSQLLDYDYLGYAEGLARVRAFIYPVNTKRTGAAEAYLALPNREYCDLVHSVYGSPFSLSPFAQTVFGRT